MERTKQIAIVIGLVIGGYVVYKIYKSLTKEPPNETTTSTTSPCGTGQCHKNNGTCVAGVCVCRPGFTGSDCSALNKCGTGTTCSGHGRCDPATGLCLCYSGYSGSDCSGVRKCQGRRCSDRGECDEATGGCICYPGFSGVNCEIDNQGACAAKSCGSNGVCQVVGGVAQCRCINNYSGQNCELPPADVCLGVRCGLHGNCVSVAGGNGYKCKCSDGYTGDACQNAPVPIDRYRNKGTWLSTSGLDNSSDYLGVNEYITSLDRKLFLLLQRNGVLAIYHGAAPEERTSDTPVWLSSGPRTEGTYVALLQRDGNFALYYGTDNAHYTPPALWMLSAHKVYNPNYVLQLQSDANICVRPGQRPGQVGPESCCSMGESTFSSWCKR